jgi:hypothetical protein
VYRLVAQALSTVTGTYNQFREITVTVTANPVMWVDQPATGTSVNQSFTISGWAIEQAAASGTGVNTVHIWAYPNPGSGQAPIWVGTPTYGIPRYDVAAIYGSQFTNSGFSMTATLPPGVYQLYIAAYSLVANGFNQVQHVTITVATSQPVMSIDTPGTGWWLTQPFHVGGWAIDLDAPSGTGSACGGAQPPRARERGWGPANTRNRCGACACDLERGSGHGACGPSAAQRRVARASGEGPRER